MIVGVLAGVATLFFLVLVHELGHFLAAKATGVTVEEFGFGYPPRLFGKYFRGTLYSFNLLPLGGFVKLSGEDGSSDKDTPPLPPSPGSLALKSIPVRLLVLVAGAGMNALLPIALFSLGFMIPQETVGGQVRIEQVMPGSPAEQAGIQPGDVVLKVDGRPIRNVRDVGYTIQLNLGSEMTMTLQRDRFTIQEVRVVPRWNPPPGQGATGIVISMANSYPTHESYAPWEAIPLGLQRSLDMFVLLKNGIFGMFVSQSGPAFTGPIGIVQITGEVAKGGIPPLLEWAALLSMNLAVINLLPLPALDGGRVFFVLLEAVRGGRRVPPAKEGLVHLVGFALLIALALVVSYNDIARIIRGESLLR